MAGWSEFPRILPFAEFMAQHSRWHVRKRPSGYSRDTMGMHAAGEDGDRRRFEIGDGTLSWFVDVIETPTQRGRQGAGSVHHIAWRTARR